MSPESRPEIRAPRGHDEVLAGLWRAAASDRLPHALLFEGPAGIGKFRAALWLAVGLLCEEGPAAPCGRCGACRRALSGNHPDLFVVDVVSEEIETLRIARMVERPAERVHKDDRDAIPVETFLGHVAAEGGWRVVVVREMDRANDEAQNAILKLLEEPGKQALWILETARPAALKETIQSRCVSVALQRLSPADAAAVLAEAGLDAEAAAVSARWARGSVGDALALERRAAGAVRERILGVLDGTRAPIEAAREVATLDGRFAGKTPTAQARERVRAALDLAAAVVADLRRRDLGVPAEGLAHGDVAASGTPASDSPARARRRALSGAVLGDLLEVRAAVEANVAPEALLDRGFLALARLCER